MASPSKAADSSSGQPKRSDGEQGTQGTQGILSLSPKLSPPKNQIQETSVEAKLKENMEKMKGHTMQLFDSAAGANVAPGSSSSRPVPVNMLSLRMQSPLCVLKGLDVSNGSMEEEHIHVQEENLSSGTVVFGSDGSSKTTVPLIKLPLVNKFPPYTTWISLDRNQKMADDQSVSERRMYHAPYDNEALICSEGDEEIMEPEEQHQSSEQEDQILEDAIEEQGLHGEERDETHREKDKKHGKNPEVSEETESEGRQFLDETLNTISDSFDKLFCRFCLIFGCRLHGCSQKLIVPSEKLPYVPEPEQNRKPCGNQCYLTSSFSSSKEPTASDWSTMEKDLYSKGIEIFGRDSCLIARNLLSGIRTCSEVSNYMLNHEAVIPSQPALPDSCMEESGKADQDSMEQEAPRSARSWRRRGRARKFTKRGKSAGQPSSIRKGTGDEQPACKPYTPCGCQQMCGEECRCIENGTRCEKYCGCSKSCKNRFRGCHCSKNQCRTRQCPCFAAWRECDPDVCRNCWVSCGDGSLGEPPARGDGGHKCGNMTVLLKQRQRILLGRSDVAGWGAFTKNPVNKNDYVGEYTGELISHQEADRRGSVYDRADSSFLFDLNDEYVVDAHRYGDKLKFANHSPNPNCYAKIMMVAGDHRVGIFAKERIEAGEEIFYDYGYGPDQAPEWARRPQGSK